MRLFLPDPEYVRLLSAFGKIVHKTRRELPKFKRASFLEEFDLFVRVDRYIGRMLRIVPSLPIDRLVELIEIKLAAPRAAKEAS